MNQGVEVDKPNYRKDITNFQLLSKPLPPLKLLQIIDDKEFEEIVHEWAYGYLKKKYERVCLLGGVGDKGRDIAAYYDYKKGIWENYQCKHYSNQLKKSDIWLEIGKFCYNCYTGQFSVPKKYYFVSPMGVGTQVHDLLKDSVLIRNELKKNWKGYCKDKITASKSINLDASFESYLNGFNFEIFDYIEPLNFIEQLKETSYFKSRFGGLTKPRPLSKDMPLEVQTFESVYIKKILEAYSEHLSKSVENTQKLEFHPELKKDFERQRASFFSAESLKEFSRDIYDSDLKHFENLKDEIYNGIIDTIESDADNGFTRLREVLKRATDLAITNNPLINDLKIIDRKGICHHLANEREDVKWKK